MTRLSLRLRATLLGTALFAVVLCVGAVLLVSTLEDRLTGAADAVARSRVEDLLQLARSGDLPAEINNLSDNSMAQVTGSDGRVLAASPNLRGDDPVARLDGTTTPRLSTFDAPDDQEMEHYRVWYASGTSQDGEVTVYVGNSLESVSEASAAVRRSLWIGLPFVTLLLGVVIWTVVGRVLNRLDRMRAQVDRISEANLSERVRGDGVDDEVGRLAATMNAMLDRLESGAQRQRDFVADVSHDLQSPLAAQRVALELALEGRDVVDAGLLRSDVLGATTEMEHLVGDLLVLASLDAGTAAQPRLIDLDGLVLEEVQRARIGTHILIDTAGVSAAPALADPDDVRRIVRNLLENATAHARTRVTLTVELDSGCARLDVVDDGDGIPPSERDRIFDRFHRVDSARIRGGGSGLGLAIARSLAERGAGGLILVESAVGAHFQLSMPTQTR